MGAHITSTGMNADMPNHEREEFGRKMSRLKKDQGQYVK